MIIKELFQCTNEGINLYLIKSDTGYYLKNLKTGMLIEEIIRPESNLSIEDLLETNQSIVKAQPITEIIEVEDGDKELSEEEIATMLEEVF